MKQLLLISLLTLPAFFSNAQQITAYDLEPSIAGSGPVTPIGYKDKICVFARYPGTHPQLTLVDIATGAKKVYPYASNGYSNGQSFAVVGGDLYFTGVPDTSLVFRKLELWKFNSNGNHQKLTNLSVCSDTWMSNLIVLNNKIYFTSNSCQGGSGPLFEYDPATNTTKQCVFNVAFQSSLENITVFNNKLYFSSLTSTTGNEPWCYDPATGNLSLLADINPGQKNSWSWSYIVAAGKLYFCADTDTCGRELYEYDGVNPVQRVSDLNPGSGDGLSGNRNIIEFNNQIYFGGGDGSAMGLYRYDPTSKQITPVYTMFHVNGPSLMTVNAGNLFFWARDIAEGAELWKYDGTTTQRVTNMMPGSGDAFTPSSSILAYNNKLFFCGIDNVHGYELFSFDERPVNIPGTKLQDHSVKVYPNPARSVVRFSVTTGTAIDIYICDLMGRDVYHKMHDLPPSFTIEVPVNGFSPGMYAYKIRSAEGTVLRSGMLIRE